MSAPMGTARLYLIQTENGKRVDTIKYRSTFGFFGPDQALSHKKADVDPYFEWGN